jgi:hypothetical protein
MHTAVIQLHWMRDNNLHCKSAEPYFTPLLILRAKPYGVPAVRFDASESDKILHLRFTTCTENQNVSILLLKMFKQYRHILFHTFHSVPCTVHIWQVNI